MKLTSDYGRVKALFNTPLEQEIEYEEDFIDVTTSARFIVGPFVYSVAFYPESAGRGSSTSTIRVEFRLVDIDAMGDELVALMSRAKRGETGEKSLSLEEASKMKRQILKNQSYDELAITGPYVLRIFGSVLSIVKDYVKKNRFKVSCLSFSADSQDRARIYQRMAKSAFPGARMEASPSPWGLGGTEIKVCLTSI
jgi:hypothetical protein